MGHELARTDGEALYDEDRATVYLAALRAFIARRVANRDLVEDLVQESYVRLLARARQNPVHEPQAYLFRIASNLLADLGRGGKAALAHAEPLPDDLLEVAADQENERRRADLQRLLEQALAELSPRCRQVFVMRRFDELDTGAIADRLGISQRMVQKHLIAAVSHLYQRLGHLRSERQ